MTPSGKRQTIALLLITLPVAFWLFVIIRYAVNIPWFDDFDPFPDFLRHWILSENVKERIELIFQPNNEHRMIWGKITALLYYQLIGTLDFRAIQIIASFLTLGILYLFWRVFKLAKVPLVYFIPVPFFIFHLQFYGTFLWAICSMQHQPVVFFTILSCWFLSRKQMIPGIIAAICANFAMGNGILVWTAGFAILLYQKNYRVLSLWSLIAAVNIALYFVGMSPQGNESSFAFFTQNPHLSFIGFFTFLGGLFDLSPDREIRIRNIPTFIGGFIAGSYVTVWVLKKVFTRPAISDREPDKQKAISFLIGVLVFILANATVIALLRPRFGMDVMLVSNYKIYPGIFLATAYISLLFARTKSPVIYKTGAVLAIALWTLTIVNYFPTIRERSYYLQVNAYNQRYNQFGLGFEPGSEAASYIDKLVKFVDDKQIYQLPEAVTPLVKQLHHSPPSAVRVEHHVDLHGDLIHISIPDISTTLTHAPLRFICFSSEGKNYLFKAEPNINRGRNPFRKFEKGLHLSVHRKMLAPGTYQVSLYDQSTGQHFLLDPVVNQ